MVITQSTISACSHVCRRTPLSATFDALRPISSPPPPRPHPHPYSTRLRKPTKTCCWKNRTPPPPILHQHRRPPSRPRSSALSITLSTRPPTAPLSFCSKLIRRVSRYSLSLSRLHADGYSSCTRTLQRPTLPSPSRPSSPSPSSARPTPSLPPRRPQSTRTHLPSRSIPLHTTPLGPHSKSSPTTTVMSSPTSRSWRKRNTPRPPKACGRSIRVIRSRLSRRSSALVMVSEGSKADWSGWRRG